jgi:hypothetical protein
VLSRSRDSRSFCKYSGMSGLFRMLATKTWNSSTAWLVSD